MPARRAKFSVGRVLVDLVVVVDVQHDRQPPAQAPSPAPRRPGRKNAGSIAYGAVSFGVGGPLHRDADGGEPGVPNHVEMFFLNLVAPQPLGGRFEGVGEVHRAGQQPVHGLRASWCRRALRPGRAGGSPRPAGRPRRRSRGPRRRRAASGGASGNFGIPAPYPKTRRRRTRRFSRRTTPRGGPRPGPRRTRSRTRPASAAGTPRPRRPAGPARRTSTRSPGRPGSPSSA